MDTDAFLRHMQTLSGYRGQMAHVERVPAREARTRAPEPPLPAPLEAMLRERGMFPLYTHQAQAVEAAARGENVVVATPTASGKSLCYHLPVISALLGRGDPRALYLFPTKALAQDQLRSLRDLTKDVLPNLAVAAFDGDTPQRERTAIKKSGRVVITNPDMLHLGILPNHSGWATFFRRLRFVVVDEAHIYRGVFGSHVANVLRRLLRVCRLYGNAPQIIACSATIGNPREHLERLAGLPFTLVDDDGSAAGAKDFVFWNPPLLDQATGQRRSALGEATNLFTQLVNRGHRTICFTRTRRLAEVVYVYARESLQRTNAGAADRITPYRAGYLADLRRDLERRLFTGDLLGVIATTALELGIDVGGLEASVLTGYPGSVAATWQQAGRSGRGGAPSLSFLVGLEGPLDQYVIRHPEAIFRRRPEDALIDPENPYVLKSHLLCASYEAPLEGSDEALFGAASAAARGALEQEGRLNAKGARWFPSAGESYPAQDVNIRAASGDTFFVVDVSNGYRLLETVEAGIAYYQCHPGAVYLHQGETFVVYELNLQSKTAFVKPEAVPYYTQARDITDLRVIEERRAKAAGAGTVHVGTVEVTNRVVGFRRKAHYTEEIMADETLDLPPRSYQTVALWWDVSRETGARYASDGLDFAGTLHAAEHAAIGMLPLFALCDRADIGGLSTALHLDTGGPVVFIYDGHPGGAGIAERGYDRIEELWETTLRTVAECPCEDGCPSCIQSPKCGNNNQPLDKQGARRLLTELLGRTAPSLGVVAEGAP